MNSQTLFDEREEDGGTCEEPLSLPVEEGVHRYEIVRKLGWASYSTVWLCVDTSAPHKTHVAVKILNGHATACIVGGFSPEYAVFRRIESINPHHPGFPHCLAISHCFVLYGSVRVGHICFVTDVLGSNMRTLRSAQPNERFSVPITKRIIKQVLLAIDYLHRECGYAHTDFRVDNVLAALPDPIVPQIDKCLEEYPSATCENLEAPSKTIKSQPLTDFNLDLRDLRVRLIDYGAASPIDKHLHDEFYQANVIRAPEVTLGHPWSDPVDIWSIKCLIKMVNLDFNRFLLSDCSLLRVDKFVSSSFEDILYHLGTVQADGVPCLAAFMRRRLALDPTSRASALELLNDRWLADV
ncbi:kinase-like domain-containing protein [Suillus ampliporus]|nr:kinase-like domain-containing protein [Suillus ampliporus]